ncbi:hypothetical protein VNO80_22557 [Phaseolus coccineus]|uniref:Uncharacterized protein n=1 Tax=Phaseolus coccineus TaxID=3886 RepID=A0AAN9M864_PHACN
MLYPTAHSFIDSLQSFQQKKETISLTLKTVLHENTCNIFLAYSCHFEFEADTYTEVKEREALILSLFSSSSSSQKTPNLRILLRKF